MIQGETGSGNEVLARELHEHSPRAGQPLLKLNCAALPSELVESELFGYERGAFTGAFQKKAGMFELADGGTILLDEIGDMDVRLQAKLLQVLQDHEFHRVGGRDLIKVNVRPLAATHRDLERAIADRTFREDLYNRLNVINLHLPPLRERKEDIVGLAEHLLRKHTTDERRWETGRRLASVFAPIVDSTQVPAPAGRPGKSSPLSLWLCNSASQPEESPGSSPSGASHMPSFIRMHTGPLPQANLSSGCGSSACTSAGRATLPVAYPNASASVIHRAEGITSSRAPGV